MPIKYYRKKDAHLRRPRMATVTKFEMLTKPLVKDH